MGPLHARPLAFVHATAPGTHPKPMRSSCSGVQGPELPAAQADVKLPPPTHHPPTPHPAPAQLLPAWKPCTLHGAPRYPEECALLQEDRHEGQQGPLRGRQGEGSSEGEDSRCAAHAPALLSAPAPPAPAHPCLGAVLRHALCAHAPAHHRPPRSMPEPSWMFAWPFQPYTAEQESPPPKLRCAGRPTPGLPPDRKSGGGRGAGGRNPSFN